MPESVSTPVGVSFVGAIVVDSVDNEEEIGVDPPLFMVEVFTRLRGVEKLPEYVLSRARMLRGGGVPL